MNTIYEGKKLNHTFLVNTQKKPLDPFEDNHSIIDMTQLIIKIEKSSQIETEKCPSVNLK